MRISDLNIVEADLLEKFAVSGSEAQELIRPIASRVSKRGSKIHLTINDKAAEAENFTSFILCFENHIPLFSNGKIPLEHIPYLERDQAKSLLTEAINFVPSASL